MKKILFYINLITYGGAERVLVNLANEFSKRDYQVILVTSYYNDKKEAYEIDKNIKRISLQNSKENKLFIIKNIILTYKLRKICKQENIDVVISFMAEPNFRAIISTTFLGTKNVISIRNDPNMEYPNFLYKILAKILYPFASGCVFQTEEAKKWFDKSVQIKSEIILNHVDKKFYQVKFEGVRKDIVTVGRLEKQKNQKLLIEAFGKIAIDFPDENLIIYGDGSEKESLEKLTKSLCIENRVIFKGFYNDIQEEIKGARVFVLSSDYEGLPNAVMEAMSLGLPVISTDCPCGGPKLLISNNENGILVNVGDLEEMVIALYKILSNRELAESLEENAKIKSFEFESVIIFNKWEQYIKNIIYN